MANTSSTSTTSLITIPSVVWPQWCQQCVTSTGSSTQIDIWPYWGQLPTTSISTGNVITLDSVWPRWVNVVQGWASTGVPIIEIDHSEIEASLRREWQQEREQAAVLRDEADKRALALLMEFLTEEQRQQFDTTRYFEVLSRDKKRRYRLHDSWAGNIQVFDENGRAVEKLCIHPKRQMPIADSLIAQKLMLETDEESLRRIANITRLVA